MQLQDVQDIFLKNQLPESFGLNIIEVGKDFMVGQLTVDERHLRPRKIMNGGVSLVLLETLGSASSCLFIDLKTQNTFGIQVSANHLSVAKPGDILTARITMLVADLA